MVYPRENGLLSFSKFVACTLVAFQGASAQEVTTTAITAQPGAAVTCTASSGDIAVGVQAIPDASCKAGGLGCYSDICRFCKYSETSNSAHLLACSSFGYIFPSLAPEPTTISAGDCGVSEGDLAVGIRAVSDATCASGGLGCYSDHCRYCKEKETTQSGHLNSCSLYGTVVTTAPATGTTAPVVIDSTAIPVVVDTTAAPLVVDSSVAPVAVDTAAPIVVDTAAPVVVDTAAPVIVDTAAPVIADTGAPSDADPSVVDTVAPLVSETAVPVVVDTSAPVVVDTAAPVAVDTIAPLVVDTAAPVAVDTIAPLVVDTVPPVVVDPSVVTGTSAPVSVNTLAPAVIDTTPGTVIPNSDVPSDGTTSAPVDGSTSTEEPIFWQADQVPTECTADESFVILGIDAVADPTVVDTDFDFYSTGCRLCKTIDLPDYDAFMSCALFPSYTSSGTTTTSPAVDATGSVATETLAPIDDGTLAPVDIIPTDDVAPTCALTVSDGDAAVGIDIISDANCSSGGLGCIDSSCRFCKLWTTPQSTHLYNCTDLLSPPAETPAPTTECLFTVSVGDAAAGIDLITDASCANGGLGCHTDVCRYCKNTNTTLSAHLEYCSVYTSGSVFGELDVSATECSIDSSYKVLGIDVATDTTVTNDDNDYYMDGCRFCKLFDTPESSTFKNCSSISGYGATPTCTKVVSSGDASAGINITTDATCSSGGTGCIDSICRFCKVTETYQSAHFVNCSAIGTSAAATTPAPAATSAPGAIPLTCTATATSGDASVGLSVVTDMSCGDGGVGCTSSICRLCRTFNTSQSLTYMNCSDVKYIDTSDINLVPIPAVDTTTTDAPVTTTAAPVATTSAPVATTAAPVATTAAPVATTSAPVATTADPATTTAAPTTTAAAPVATCTETVSDGDKAVGLDIVTDVKCLTGGLGCIGGSVCKFCKTAVTTQSTTYDYCPGYPKPVAAPVAPVLSALRVQDAGGNAESGDTGLMAKVSDFVSNDGALPAFIAAAIGCVAVVAVVAVGARRVVRRLRRTSSSDASASVEEDDSVLSAVTEDGAATATGVEDAGDV